MCYYHVTVREGRGGGEITKPGLVFRSSALDFLCGALFSHHRIPSLWMQINPAPGFPKDFFFLRCLNYQRHICEAADRDPTTRRRI